MLIRKVGDNAHIPISRAKAERSSIVGVMVRVNKPFSASSWYGSGLLRLGRDCSGPPYGVVLRRIDERRVYWSSIEGDTLGDRRSLAGSDDDKCVEECVGGALSEPERP